jgi:hypothetical protein
VRSGSRRYDVIEWPSYASPQFCPPTHPHTFSPVHSPFSSFIRADSGCVAFTYDKTSIEYAETGEGRHGYRKKHWIFYFKRHGTAFIPAEGTTWKTYFKNEIGS